MKNKPKLKKIDFSLRKECEHPHLKEA